MKHTSDATFVQSNSVCIKDEMSKQLGLRMEQKGCVRVIIYLDLYGYRSEERRVGKECPV